MWCVGCSVWVLTQEQAEAAEAAKKATGGPTQPPPPPEAAEKRQQQPQPRLPSEMRPQATPGSGSSREPPSKEGEMAAQPSNSRAEPPAPAPGTQ